MVVSLPCRDIRIVGTTCWYHANTRVFLANGGWLRHVHKREPSTSVPGKPGWETDHEVNHKVTSYIYIFCKAVINPHIWSGETERGVQRFDFVGRRAAGPSCCPSKSFKRAFFVFQGFSTCLNLNDPLKLYQPSADHRQGTGCFDRGTGQVGKAGYRAAKKASSKLYSSYC